MTTLAWLADKIEIYVSWISNMGKISHKYQIQIKGSFVISNGQQKKFDCYLVFLAICLSI